VVILALLIKMNTRRGMITKVNAFSACSINYGKSLKKLLIRPQQFNTKYNTAK
jgi:hypothetical protein